MGNGRLSQNLTRQLPQILFLKTGNEMNEKKIVASGNIRHKSNRNRMAQLQISKVVASHKISG